MSSGDTVLEYEACVVHESMRGSTTVSRWGTVDAKLMGEGAVSGAVLELNLRHAMTVGTGTQPDPGVVFDPTKTYDVIIKEH
jgi:hypothetical protein